PRHVKTITEGRVVEGVGDSNPAGRPARGKAPTSHRRGPNKIFEGALEAGVPVPSDPALLFLNRLSPFSTAWSNITTDRWIIQTVQRGYQLQFVSPPSSHPPTPSL
ncbi:hypothetical protein G0U57_011575, partial [Chelydra serpentina]